MPATQEQVQELFQQHQGQTVIRELRGDGRRVARQIRLIDPDSVCDHFIHTAVGPLNIDGTTAVAQGPDGRLIAFVFQQ